MEQGAAEPARAARAGISAGAWWMLAVLTLLYVASMIDRQVIGLLVPHIKADLGINDFQISLASGAAFALFYSFVGLPVGYAVDRYSRRVVVFVGVLAWGLATVACGLAGSFLQLAVARFFVGAGEAALSPAAYSLFGDRIPRHKLGLATAIFGIGASVGVGIAFGFGGFVMGFMPPEGIASPFGLLKPWQATFVAAAIPALVALPLIFTFREPVRTRHPTGPRLTDGLRFVIHHKRFFAPYFSAYGILLVGTWSFSMWVPMVFVRHYGMTIKEAGSLLMVISALGSITGGILFGTLTDRLAKRGHTDAPVRCYRIAGLGFALGGLLLMAAPPYPWIIAVCLLLFVSSGLASLASAIPATAPSHVRGQVSALFLLCGNLLGIGAGPSIVAAFTDFVYRDEKLVHMSIGTTLVVVGPIASVLLWLSMRPMREAVAAHDHAHAAAHAHNPAPGGAPVPA